jgi:molecular chaperone GrpE
MSGDDDQQPDFAGDMQDVGDIEQVMRAAEEAVDKVRRGPGSADEDEDGDLGEADLAAELEQAQAENAALRDKWLRAIADLDNYKKRVKRDMDDASHRTVQNLLASFLPIGDNLERALSVAPPDTNEQLLRGLEMVRTEFFSALGKHGITPVESVGRTFDPNLHDALQQMDTPEFAPGVVMLEYEKGYRRGDKLLRPARVVVAGPGSTGAPPAQTSGSPGAGGTN